MNVPLLFVAGVGRSGTSLVQSLLASHSRIRSLPETGFFRRYVVSGRIDEIVDSRGSTALIETFREDSVLSRLDLDLPSITKNWLRRRRDAHFLYLDVLAAQTDASDGIWVCDKDPRLIEHVHVLARLFPEARILHVIRDPRDVLTSRKKAAWSRGRHSLHNVAAAAAQWAVAMRRCRDMSDGSYLEVKYEDILTAPERTLTTVCEWLELPFEAGMLAFNETAESLISQDEMQWKKETLKPLMTANAGRWRESLSCFEIAAVQAANADVFRHAGYSYRPVRGMSRAAGTVCGVAVRTLAASYATARILRDG